MEVCFVIGVECINKSGFLDLQSHVILDDFGEVSLVLGLILEDVILEEAVDAGNRGPVGPSLYFFELLIGLL